MWGIMLESGSKWLKCGGVSAPLRGSLSIGNYITLTLSQLNPCQVKNAQSHKKNVVKQNRHKGIPVKAT